MYTVVYQLEYDGWLTTSDDLEDLIRKAIHLKVRDCILRIWQVFQDGTTECVSQLRRNFA